jgi:DNA polymerase III epsilon subunit-like protein
MRLPRLRRPQRSAAASAYADAAADSPGTPWRQASFAAVDLETTGLDPRSDEIISFAAVPIAGGRVVVGGVRTAVVRPLRMPDSDTIRIHGLRPADLHTSRKSRTIALARGIAMYLARKHTDMSFPEIGRFMGGKNHSTVILACRRIGLLLSSGATAQWTSSGGPRSKDINVIVEDIEAQSGAASGAVALGAA